MTLRPAPGAQLAAGRLRVDATKAIAKLREYQLVDRTAWILEAIRAAVAAGATAIDLQGDANDVWLAWAGTPWPADDLPRLFDELVSPEPGASRHHVRLLAAAVNSALGARPAYVDVIAVAEGGAVRARYTPDVLEAPASDLEESRLQQVAAEPTSAPPGAPVGMYLHFRRRASVEVLSTWLRRADPPELVLARAACADIAVPIQIGDTLLHRETSTHDVLRVPLGDDLDGWLAIVDTTHVRLGPNRVELALAERGVLLEQASIRLGLAARRPTPLRVVIDAARMPTNASRSEVRRDTHPVSTGERRAQELVPALIARLVAQAGPPHADPRARHAAIHLLASVIGGDDWALRACELEPPLRALAELPLVRDAAGVPRPVCWAWSGLVHAATTPLPAELAPWLAHVLWAPPDDPTSAIARGSLRSDDLARHLRRAKQERRAEKKFHRHAPREARVLGRAKPRVRVRLGAPFPESCIPDATFDGLTGEVCVYAERRGSELTVLLGGRELETVEFDSELPFAAVIDCDRVTPTNRFRGVARDAAYAHVERAMRAGVVRALEAVARAHAAHFVADHQVAVGVFPGDRSQLRSAIYLARNLGAPLTAPFEHARIWRTTDGERSIAELRGHRVLGIVASHAQAPAPGARLVVAADGQDRALLAALVSARWVPYEASQLERRVLPSELAMQIGGAPPHVLAIEDGERVVAIAPAAEARVQLYHRGRAIAAHASPTALAPCTIAVDADELVPREDWSALADAPALDVAPYERRLAQAAVRALLGEHVPELHGGDPVALASPLGRWLCEALRRVQAAEVLGEELAQRLELASLFRVLGDPRRYAIAELAVMFPETIVYVEHVAEPVEDYPVIVAEATVAELIARLAKRKLRDGQRELGERRAQLARSLRLGTHRAQPVVPLEVAGTSVTISHPLGHGLIGCGRDALEIRVLVEGRPFQTITDPKEVPLACMFELADPAGLDERFEALLPETVRSLVAHVRARGPDLLRAIAARYPEAFAEAGPRRTLLAAYARRFPLAVELREALVGSLLLPSVQGPRVKLLDARRGDGIRTCAWAGDWLPHDGTPDVLDAPILLVAGSPELALVISALANVVDVTPEIDRLQTQRRIARGLLPAPKCIDVMPELTRPLADLATTHALGPGEIALVGGASEVLLHAAGVLCERVALDCLPAVQLAIEAADLVGDAAGVATRVGPEARRLAVLLVQRIVAQHEARTLPVEIRRNLRRAVLASRLAMLHDAPIFETITGAWIDLATVHAQRALFGDLWCVVEEPTPDLRPLDDRRVVLLLSARDQHLANEHGLPATDASYELVLDAKTRRNRARPPAASLAPDGHGIIGTVELTGDGIVAPRGIVAVLAPDAAHHRALQLHRAMHPFDRAPDPCRWPTIAKLDDARFTPDRTWEQPHRDEVYKAAIDALHRASNDALRAIAPAPATALASLRIAPWTYDSITLLRTGDTQLRGTLWLEGPPIPPVTPLIRVVEAGGETTFVPLRGLGLAGTIFVHATRAWEREPILETLCKAVHVKLVKELAFAQPEHSRAPDLVTAHVAWALALARIEPADARHVTFACFRPHPLDATQLAALLAATTPVTLVAPSAEAPDLALVDDGSETSRVLVSWFGSRLVAPARAARRPDTVEPAAVAAHPLQPFVDRLHARIIELGVQVHRWRIVEGRDEPVIRYADENLLELAADHRLVIDTAAACAAGTAWSAGALDAIAAHCITVLNVALAQITDATEARAIARLLD